jgi:peptide/nickel transport system substrate-binding protein
MRLVTLALACLLALPASAQTVETPMLAAEVAAGRLPPLAARLPSVPRVIDLAAMGREPGRHGGTWRMLIGNQRDIRFMPMFGNARLVVFDQAGELQPDILERVDVEEGRVFTLRLRPGHRWSDGHPFTAEDFRYWWEDVANEPRLSPGGPPPALVVDGRLPRFEVIDRHTVRYSFDAPNPVFLPSLAAPAPLVIALPAHYLRQFHVRHADADPLQAAVRAARVRDWGALHERQSRQTRPENPDLPVLDPWRNRTRLPAEYFVFERNPFFHRVDADGRQLPYIDRVTLSVGTASLIAAKVAAGEADLQPRYLRFESYTFLRAAERRHDYSVRLWTRGQGSFAALMPNLNAADPVWRGLMRDVRFRRALSLGINRRDINRVVFFGLARESANTVLPQSPLHDEAFDRAYAGFDLAEANRLLDEAGLSRRALDGVRLLPDGRRAEITIDTAGENSEEVDIILLIADDWARLGIRVFPRSTQRDVFRRRVMAGQTIMSMWGGLDNGTPSPNMEPDQMAPTSESQLNWPLWGKFYETGGRTGERPDYAPAIELAELHMAWRRSTTREERADIWRRMLAIHADQVLTIGIVNGTSEPIAVSNRLRNVPREAVYAYEPGGYLGVTMPDTFWFADAAPPGRS